MKLSTPLIHFFFLDYALALVPSATLEQSGRLVSRSPSAQVAAPCTTAIKSPLPAGYHCGEHGQLDPKKQALIKTTSAKSQTICRDACFSTPTCQTFSYNPTTKACGLYSKTIDAQGWKATPKGPQFWNKFCYKTTCPQCPVAGQTKCGATCSSLSTDNQNCGLCGNSCGLGSSCVRGHCECNEGWDSCDRRRSREGVCYNLQDDDENCGRCFNECQDGSSCNSGRCVCEEGDYCRGSCVDYDTDPQNCGSCGNACGDGMSCSGGQCSCGLATAQVCNTDDPVCIDTATDVNNCGSCGNFCGDGASCSGGQCSCDVATARVCDTNNRYCTDLLTDGSNCGGCNNRCGLYADCTDGACKCLWEGYDLCNGDFGDCVNLVSNDNCGACGVKCSGIHEFCSADMNCLSGYENFPANNVRDGSGNIHNFIQVFHGKAVTVSTTDNPAGATRVYSGDKSPYDAITQCAIDAINYDSSTIYQSYEVYYEYSYEEGDAAWICQLFDINIFGDTPADVFSVEDSNVELVFGYVLDEGGYLSE